MTFPLPHEFARIAGRVNLPLLRSQKAVIVGIGSVGSQLARELALAGIGNFCIIDGDSLELPNLPRHALTREYVGWNKAEGMAHFLRQLLPHVNVEFLAQDIDTTVSDATVDDLLADADVVVAATDNRDVQQRLGQRVLALDVPGVFPALYEQGGGEVFVSFDSSGACLTCWEAFRTGDTDLRAVTALNAEILSVVALAVHITLGVLDTDSTFAELIAPAPDNPRPHNLFVLTQFAALRYTVVAPVPNCRSCAALRPSPRRHGAPPPPQFARTELLDRIAEIRLRQSGEFGTRVFLLGLAVAFGLLLLEAISAPPALTGLLTLAGGFGVYQYLGDELRGRVILGAYLLAGALILFGVVSVWATAALLVALVVAGYCADRM